jgi:hypothetical protein
MLQLAMLFLTQMFFFRIFDELLEQQNSKEPIKLENRETLLSVMQRAESYLTSLRDAAGNQLLLSPTHGTGLLGLLSNISASQHMFSQLVERGKLNELLPSQLSLDQLELFLGALRASGGGSGELPTADQFGCAYKRHILHGSQGRYPVPVLILFSTRFLVYFRLKNVRPF